MTYNEFVAGFNKGWRRVLATTPSGEREIGMLKAQNFKELGMYGGGPDPMIGFYVADTEVDDDGCREASLSQIEWDDV